MAANTSSIPIVTKTSTQDRVVVLDFATLLTTTGVTLANASFFAPSPLTTPSLVVTVLGTSGTTVTAQFSGGVDSANYGMSVALVDNYGNTYTVQVAALVKNDLGLRYTGGQVDPYSFQNLLGSIEVGTARVGKALFVLPNDDNSTDLSSGYVSWSLVDTNGNVFSYGNAYDFRLTQTSTSQIVEAASVVNVPTTTPPGQYQIRWALTAALGATPVYSFESISIDTPYQGSLGAADVVEMIGDIAKVTNVTARAYSAVSVDVFAPDGNAKLVTIAGNSLASARLADNAWYYEGAIQTGTSPFTASLDPFILSWKMTDDIGVMGATDSTRDTGQLFIVNASILRCVKAIESVVAKAKTTLTGFQDELFTVPVIVGLLARGRDYFNGAGGVITTFDMTNSQSMIREFFLRYTEVALLQAQYLLEGEKAFNFSGQAISLDIDRSQYYQTLADTLKSSLDNDVKPLKQNLIKKGISGGDGSLSGMSSIGSTGLVGISISPASSYGSNLGGFFRTR